MTGVMRPFGIPRSRFDNRSCRVKILKLVPHSKTFIIACGDIHEQPKKKARTWGPQCCFGCLHDNNNPCLARNDGIEPLAKSKSTLHCILIKCPNRDVYSNMASNPNIKKKQQQPFLVFRSLGLRDEKRKITKRAMWAILCNSLMGSCIQILIDSKTKPIDI